MKRRWLAAGAIAALAILMACSTKSSATSDRICTPGNYVYCRCADRSEGTKLCHDDGAAFDACSCATDSNPEVPTDPNAPPPPAPPPGDDGGSDAPSGPPVCGNGKVETGETCDDGNVDDTDGCDRYCDLAGADPASSKACPGTEVNLWGTDVVYDGSTAALVGQGNCSIDKACPGTSGNQATNGAAEPERIFHVTAHKTGTLSVQTTNVDFDNFLYAADHCTLDPPSPIDPYLKCANGAAGIGPETLIMAVDAGKSYTIVVDGSGIVLDAPDRGNFRVTFSLY